MTFTITASASSKGTTTWLWRHCICEGTTVLIETHAPVKSPTY